MQDLPRNSEPKDTLLMMLGTLVGGTTTLVIITQLPLTQSILVSAVALASLIVACAYLANRLLWWTAIGAISGMIIGLGGVMAEDLAEKKEPLELSLRLTFVVVQGIAGLIAGVVLGRKIHQAHLPNLKEFLSSLSALTIGLFAVVVTHRFMLDGLELARTLSSRLSATTTILSTLLALPGAIGYLLAKRRTKLTNRNPSDRTRPSDRL